MKDDSKVDVTSTESMTKLPVSSHEVFWKEFLKDVSKTLFLSNDSLRVESKDSIIKHQTDKYQTDFVLLDKSFTLTFQEFSRQHNLEISTIFQGVWALLLNRYSGDDDVIFGFQSGLTDAKAKTQTVDHIIPLRIQFASDTFVLPWLKQIQEQWINIQIHSQVSLNQIQQWIDIPAEPRLFETLLVLGNDCALSYPLVVSAKIEPEITIQVRYDCNRFSKSTITRLLGHVQTLLQGIVANPNQSLTSLSILTPDERHQLLVEWNNTKVDYPTDKTIHQIFEEQVTKTPNAIAIVFENQHLTYKQLNQRANQLAHYLISKRVKPEILVGICVERSVEMVVGLLGIFKAGGAYVPLDPSYPQERLGYMLSDSKVNVLLTQQRLVQKLPEHQAQMFCLDTDWISICNLSTENPNSGVQAANLAYVIYTSGSTGQPKGVLIPHQGLLNLVFWHQRTFQITDSDRATQLAGMAFDASVWEIWPYLSAGASIYLAPPNILNSLHGLRDWLIAQQITICFVPTPLVEGLLHLEWNDCCALRILLTGGDTLHHYPSTKIPFKLVNNYGPTENTVVTTSCLVIADEQQEVLPLIGRPISNTKVYILDQNLQPLPIGFSGELYIAGNSLAKGYLNRPELTQEKFIPNIFSDDSSVRLYKTGDLARYLSNGNLEYLGRIDHQVKIRGFRIELGEIEATLIKHNSIQECIVVSREDQPSTLRLVAYFVPNSNWNPTSGELRIFLKNLLPEYMVPTSFVQMDSLPLTINGKVDRRALPTPGRQRPELEQAFISPRSSIEKQLGILWCELLGLEQIGVLDNFFELGGTSLLGTQMIAQLQQFGWDLRAVKLYQYPNIRSLAKYLSQTDLQRKTLDVAQIQSQKQRNAQGFASNSSRNIHKTDEATQMSGIAIIGMVGRFPGAKSVEDLWSNLCEGFESTTFFAEQELDPSVDTTLREDPNYVKARGIIQGAENFDAAFFGISPREAEAMDPQSRVFLEVVQEALEKTGYVPDFYAGLIGLYAGCGENTYFSKHICGRQEVTEQLGELQITLGNEKDFLCTRTSYKLNLKGPSISINTACSTSLVAIIQAFQALISYQCDLALAGGVSISTPQNRGYLYQEGSMLSPDGRCRPFDVNAQGTMFNNGIGLVALKRLDDAIAHGDLIYAVIKGVGINNDGSEKVSFTAPSVDGQAGAIIMAQSHADIHPDTITYIETHGTATPLGDPIEIEALTQAFRNQTDAKQFCAIGSIKSNVGHLVAAAGVTGLIKTALSLYYKKIPPSLNFESPNPEIDFANSPFYVNNKLVDWREGETPRRAGVSSFGVGGTNAHVVLEEAPLREVSSPSRPYQLLRLSAKTSAALEQSTINLKEYLTQNVEANLADIAYTLDTGRKAYNHRRFIICRDRLEAIATLESLDVNRSATRLSEFRNPDVVFMFPGQGSQYLNMGKYFYEHEIVFRNAVDRCAEILSPLLDRDLLQVIYSPQSKDRDDETATALLRQTQYTQPALFTIEYALALLWQSWGIRPAAMIGHSIGEFVAACLAGVFSLEDGLKLIATRARMMGQLPAGSMLSVRLPADVLQKRLSEDLAIAAINGASLCVVAGPTEQVANLQQQLEAEEIVCRTLHTSHAFHSPMMDPIIEPFAEMVKTIQLAPPKIPFVSTVTTDWITDAQATDPMYWASHLRATVRFAEGAKKLWEQPERVLLEVGPRTTTATLARQQAKDLKRQIAISSLGSTADNDAECAAILQAIGQLWLAGVDLDRQEFYTDEYRHRLPLPTYPFERKRYWIDPKPAIEQTLSAPLPSKTAPIQPLSETQPLLSLQSLEPNSISKLQVQSNTMSETRKQQLIPKLQEVLETTSGIEIDGNDGKTTFLEMGLDSLSLTQVAMALKKKFKVKITFRHLLEDYPNLDTLSDFVLKSLPADAFPAPITSAETISPPVSFNIPAANIPAATLAPSSPSTYTPAMSYPIGHINNVNGTNNNGSVSVPAPSINPELASPMQTVVSQQLQIMAQQLQLLSQSGGIVPAIATPVMQTAAPSVIKPEVQPEIPIEEITATSAPAINETKPTKSFGPGAKIEKSISSTLTFEQQKSLDRITARYISRTQESKRQTQEHRKYLADPRTVSGFTPLLKEMVYPIVTDRALGSKLWDIDGNEYVDITNGFGLNFFGWSPDFVTEAIKAQLDKGIEIGPQTPLAGKVAKLVAEFTGMERVAFCNTGSEAVMATLRLARTVTGRDLVATFAGDYHGTFDEVLYRQGAKLKTLPAAPGILPAMFENLLVLDYNTPESLEILRDRADDLAAILVEPVRSRDPNVQPKEFLQDLRCLTEQSGTAYIFDEVVTGFRVHPGGAQAYFNIQADMATYGKVVGGGLPIGIVAGKAEYMDALDGGFWQYGDSSIPEVGVTFFAGTFVRHPLALAAAEAVLNRLKKGGPELQRSLAEKVNRFATHLNQYFKKIEAPIEIAHFSSFFYINYPHDLPYASLLFYLLREKGVHAWDHRPCFFTLSHTDADIEFVIRAFKDSVAEMQMIGFLPKPSSSNNESTTGIFDRNIPPQIGARLGRDPEGNPAWYIPDLERPGKYLQVGNIS